MQTLHQHLTLSEMLNSDSLIVCKDIIILSVAILNKHISLSQNQHFVFRLTGVKCWLSVCETVNRVNNLIYSLLRVKSGMSGCLSEILFDFLLFGFQKQCSTFSIVSKILLPHEEKFVPSLGKKFSLGGKQKSIFYS